MLLTCLLFSVYQLLLRVTFFSYALHFSRNTDTRRLDLKFFVAQIQIPLPNKYLGVGYKGLVFCRNNGWIMENMDKELTVPKWVLIVRPKIPQMPQKISDQNVWPSPKVRDFWKKALSGCPYSVVLKVMKNLKDSLTHLEAQRSF